ncbi:MAG TPA: lipopolysaccharide assembly protein LapA domain-containing protein [Acidimicrobiia bacterium]
MSDERRPQRQTRQLPPARIIVAAIIGVLLLWFAIINRQRVEIDFIVFERDARLIYIIIGSAVLGAIAGALLRRRRERRERRRNRD